jgi:hypothetical protein
MIAGLLRVMKARAESSAPRKMRSSETTRGSMPVSSQMHFDQGQASPRSTGRPRDFHRFDLAEPLRNPAVALPLRVRLALDLGHRRSPCAKEVL